MRVLKFVIFVLIGLIVLPISWVLRKLRIIAAREDPADFVALIGHFLKHDLSPTLNMRTEQVNNAEALAWLVFGASAAGMKVITVARCATEELARTVENEMLGAPQYTDVGRNGKYVMGCTFVPQDPELADRSRRVFLSFSGDG